MRIDLTIPDDAPQGRFGVYVLFGEGDTPLYIGFTRHLFARLKSHRTTQPWWHLVRRLEWCACDGPDEARAAEKSMIETFRPLHNQVDFKPLVQQGHQTLPSEVVAHLVELHEIETRTSRSAAAQHADRLDRYLAALKSAGWTLNAIGFALGMTRERARQRIARASSSVTTYPVPTPPPRPRKPKPEPKYRNPDADVVAELLALKPMAMRVRRMTRPDSPNRVASVRYTELLAEQVIAGIPVSRLAKALGVTPLAITARIARHGYTEPVPGLPGNTPYGTASPLKTVCGRGHRLEGDNVRFINGDPNRRQCRPCERRRSAEYAERKRKAAA